MKKALIVLSLMLFITMPTAGAAPIEAVNGCQYPISMTVIAESDSSQIINVKVGDYFKVTLEAAGGTGYSWQLDNKNMDFVEAVDKTVAPVNPNLHLAGGKVRWEFYFRVKPDALGQDTLQFCLRRGQNEMPVKKAWLIIIVQ